MSIGGKTKVAGVMGWPVGHSLSPRLHGFWLEKYGVDGVLVPLPVRPEHFAQALRALPKLGLIGASVTVPHKEAALELADDVEPLARRIGAVNTIVVGPDGRLAGQNTDAPGFLSALRAGAPKWRASASAGAAVVLGAGGAARAIVAALAEAGVGEIRVVNRTHGRAAALAGAFGAPVRAVPWEKRAGALEGAALLVNATTLGMTGGPALELDLAPLPAGAAVMDIVYTPLETGLLARARKRGLVAVDGLGMLLHQARPAFAAWFGVEPEVTAELRAFVGNP
ncbi:MAG: shikimate dehydrogenase [Rhodospirillales bacterium]|nr:shikimate dehydrogenase [Rhodospirillales bacterium]MSP80610.1 shikimate dehydrogenase [Rhodospirillales bacterium]